ncbi:DUF6629 family protein [uncultured Paracoccus sp.]|uniref:DUF6629 family protein n=1 Tax=uncultured Paracoccus sp. TaxID=189685 RepID=UPI0026121A4A|nr:DUF6629 family protein [uncultured Paracoccus sp.]
MCFATASFGAGVVLIPLGGVALARAGKTDRRYLTLAAFPVLFGVQQIFEGFVWQSLDGPVPPASRAAAMVLLLFAYLLWLVLTPLAVILVEERTWLRRVFLGITIFGGAYGLSLFAPLVVNPDWLAVETARGSILYDTRLIYDGVVSKMVLRVTYAGVICLPLLLSTAPGVRLFGVLVTLSVLLAFLFATYAFTSIWCYLAAVVSAYVVFLIDRLQIPSRRLVFGA